jgi:predicted nucleotidyltransferase
LLKPRRPHKVHASDAGFRFSTSSGTSPSLARHPDCRAAAREDSDVDLFFDHERGTFGLFELMDVKETAAEILGCPADITTRGSLHPLLRERIENSAMRVF